MKARLYGVAWYLCIAFFLNVICLFTLFSSRHPLTPVVVALVAVVAGFACPKRPAVRYRWLRVALVAIVALVHLAFIGMWMYIVLGWLCMEQNMRFRAKVESADRIVIRDGGGLCHSNPDKEPVLYEITNKAEIAEFNSMFRFCGTCPECMCCGYPGIDWWRDGKRIAISALHHGYALRVEGDSCDLHLCVNTGGLICKWLKDRGIDCDDGGFPRHVQCGINRRGMVAAVQQRMRENGGRRPTIEDLRKEWAVYWKTDFPSCPSGGEYSLSFGDDGSIAVTCSVHEK